MNRKCPQCGESYSLIFMDCNMPVMDGFQATTEIRQVFTQEQIHVAALTAYSTSAFEKKCYKLGFNSFLTKPINEVKLSELLKSMHFI